MNRKNIPFEELFFSRTSDFLKVFLPRQSGKSGETIRAYDRGLSLFYDYVVDEAGWNPMAFQFSDCTYQLVLEYSQNLLEKKGLSPGTVNQRMASLKAYLRYVSDSDIARVQIYLGVKKVPLASSAKVIRPTIAEYDLQAFLDAPSSTKCGKRDRVLLILLYDTAIRVGELVSITMGDVLLDVSQPTILIHGKGRKERSIALSDEASEHLRNYVKAFHAEEPDPGTPLFYTTLKGATHPMSKRNVQRIIKKYADQIRDEHPDLPDSVYPHMLRRTKATGMYQDGIPLEMIAVVLGHSQLDTTRIYANPSKEQVADAVNKGPVAKSKNEEPLWKDPDKKQMLKQKFGLH